jgi:hypothetical protein
MGLKERRNTTAYQPHGFKNPEWQLLKGRENRMKNQFGTTETALDYQPRPVTVFTRIKNIVRLGK